MFVTFFDTCMVALAAMFVWRISPYWIIFPWLTIACLDGAYLSSVLTKVPNGAWFTLTLAAVLGSLFILWRFGKEQQWAAEAADRFPTSHFMQSKGDGRIELTERYGGSTLTTIKGFGIFFDKAGETTPVIFSQFALKLVAIPEVMVLFHLRPLETPSVAPEHRHTVSRLAIPNCYRLVVRHGYMDEVITPDLASLVYDQVRSFIGRRDVVRGRPTSTSESEPPHEQQERQCTASDLPPATTVDRRDTEQAPSPAADAEKMPQAQDDSTFPEAEMNARSIGRDLAKLDEAFAHQVLYIIGKEEMKIKPSTGIIRKVLLHVFLWIREHTRTKIANLRVPNDRIIEVGFIKDI